MNTPLRVLAEAALVDTARAQAALAEASGADPAPAAPLAAPLSQDAVQAVLHDLQVHQVELQMQNKELLRAQIKMDELRAHYFDLYDMAPVGYCTVSEYGYVMQTNLTLAKLLGLTRSELVSRSFSLFLVDSDRDAWFLQCKAQLASGEPIACELRMLRHEGPPFWAQLQISVEKEVPTKPCLRVVVTDISERKAAQAALEQSLQDKTALLQEVHHRVKNNLQIISSLLRLEAGRRKEPDSLSVLTEMQGRIRSMALLHETLYRSGNFSAIDLGAYLKELAHQAFQALAPHGGAVRLVLDLVPLHVSLDLATPCGLLANELIVNSFKHGFVDGRSGEVRIALQTLPAAADGKTVARLRISDTGIGLGPDFDATRATSLGLQMVTDLSRQIGGALVIERNTEVGAAFTVTFAFEPPKFPVKAGGGAAE
jgi:PAS domain S-box-containing protein